MIQKLALQSSAATEPTSLLKLIASNGEHNLTSESTGGKYQGMHLSLSSLFERTFFMLHSRMQDTCFNSYEAWAILSENEAISLQPLGTGHATQPHMKAMYLPFHMP